MRVLTSLAELLVDVVLLLVDKLLFQGLVLLRYMLQRILGEGDPVDEFFDLWDMVARILAVRVK